MSASHEASRQLGADTSRNPLRFDGRVAIVTGAGRGIGRAQALALARRGAIVVVNDLGGDMRGGGNSATPADDVVKEIEALGVRAVADTHDMGVEAAVRELVQRTAADLGRVDIIIHNAGVAASTWNRTVDVHLSGSFWLCDAAWPIFQAQKYGRVLLTSSGAGLFGAKPAVEAGLDYYAYGSAKMGVVGLTRNLAIEGSQQNIKVNAIAPVAYSRLMATHPDQVVLDWFRTNFPPEYVAETAVCLVHERCPSNGDTYSVGGGRVAKILISETRGHIDAALSAEGLLECFDAVINTDEVYTPRHINAEMSLYARLCDKPGPYK
jgi:NAD(P)-dependent dehydrogenase (short-subunit alcohol dehydrogenase family)